MKKELGKWLMDIAKYLATAVVISTVFSDFQEKSVVLIIGATTVLSLLLIGLILINEKKQIKKIK